MRVCLKVILLWSVLQLVCIVVRGSIHHEDAQIEWVRSKGGYFNPKLEFQLLDPQDPDSPRGVFATQDIARGESVMIIPKSCLLTAGEFSSNPCDTALNLMHQFELGEESDFAPYVNYLFSLKPGNLPSSWSHEGKKLIRTMLGKELYKGRGMTNVSYQKKCGGSGDAFEEQAFMLVHSRSWDDKMVPLYDMINHRNGPWANVDSNSVHAGRDVLIFAFRDIQAGEQVQYSYYNCADCNDFSNSYGVHDLVKDFGFVEQFPQRWHFPLLSFDLDVESHPSGYDELVVRWITKDRDMNKISFLRGHLARQKGLRDFIYKEAAKLSSDHERSVILSYYEALVTALAEAGRAWDVEFEQNLQGCTATESGDPSPCDGLEPRNDPLNYDTDVCGGVKVGHTYVKQSYQIIGRAESAYQKIYVTANDETGDACIYLNGWMQSCASFRPHYHEVLIHYSARFLQNVKRIIFIGGGDLMILHEIMKYAPSLELVVGMELDQEVVRTTFKHFGILPHWDKEIMQWWYGDATKSLRMLPTELYGTFDLVVLDLQNYVVDVLDVQDGLSMVDTAQLLMAPHGIIVKNEDFFPRKDPDFTDYTVDLNFHDVPILCQQGITMGSNSVDFVQAKRKDHNIETVFLDSVDDMKQSHYDLWYNYGANATRKNIPCKKLDAEEKQMKEEEENLGMTIILEVENANGSLDMSSVQTNIGIALANAGMTDVSTSHLEVEDEHGHVIVFVAREGYVVTHTWPKHNYCAFDIILWSNFDKVDVTRRELIASVGNQAETSVSSYRMVSGGMYGTGTWNTGMALVGPRVTQDCEEEGRAQDANKKEELMSGAFGETISLIQDNDSVVAVLCGEESSRCVSMEYMEKSGKAKKLIPIWKCPSASEDIVRCENSTYQSLREAVNIHGKINLIVIDFDASRVMGQVLYQMLLASRHRRGILADSHVAISVTDRSSHSWRRELLERFRTDFAVFDPAFRAELSLTSPNSSTMEICLFSCGDANFYANIVNLLSTIEAATGFDAELREVKNGVLNYVADFDPTIVPLMTDYNNSLAYEQWMSQHPLGHQTIFQFDLIGPKLPIEVGEDIILEGKFFHRGVISKKRVGGTYDVIRVDGRRRFEVPREEIRRTKAPDTEKPPTPSMQHLKQAFVKALRTIEFEADDSEVTVFTHMGDGCVMVALESEGSAILSWDGRTHFDVNLFTYQESMKLRGKFSSVLLNEIPFLVISGQDEQPRGFGKIVNFESSLRSRGKKSPRWMNQ